MSETSNKKRGLPLKVVPEEPNDFTFKNKEEHMMIKTGMFGASK